MVSWGWVPISLLIGALVGIFCLGMVIVAREDEEREAMKPKAWWKDDE